MNDVTDEIRSRIEARIGALLVSVAALGVQPTLIQTEHTPHQISFRIDVDGLPIYFLDAIKKGESLFIDGRADLDAMGQISRLADLANLLELERDRKRVVA